MAAIWSIIYLAALMLVGTAAANAIIGRQRRGIIETFGLAAVLGIGSTGTLLLWLSLAGVAPARWNILTLAALAMAALLVMRRRHAIEIVWPKFTRRDLPLLPIILLITYLLIVVSVAALAFPTYETDAFAIWGLKSKVLASAALVPRPEYFRDLTLSYSHLDYPLLVPMVQGGVYAMLGTVDDRWGKVVFPMMYAALGAIVYANLRRRLDRISSLLLLALLMGTPAAIRWVGAGVADIAIALFAASAAGHAAQWLRDRDRRDLIIALISCVFLSMAKHEGAAMSLSILAATIVFGRSFRSMLLPILLAVVALVPWLIWSYDLPRTHEAYGSRLSPLNIASQFHRIQPVVRWLAHQAINFDGWSILWLLLIIAAFSSRLALRRADVCALWTVFLMQLLAYIVAYLVTPWNLDVVIPMTIYRLLLGIAPLAVLLIGLHWAELSAAERE